VYYYTATTAYPTSSRCLLTKVLRRNLYKGTQSAGAYSLPVDGATAMGILLAVGTILPANSLTAEGVQASRALLSTLEEHCKLRELSCVLANGRETVRESNRDGYFSIEDLKPIFKKLGVPFNRLLDQELELYNLIFYVHRKRLPWWGFWGEIQK